ncbi:DUF418 domain-containing protein [Streptomyces sp. NPDC056528]|uniref:DUF418 domain-containing protein n=1 Tax=Streptomyces sp. NPDC056528 TaxID=3345854 RepID=UPI0036A2C265
MTAARIRGARPRVTEVDVLRGFALLGILLVNAPMAAGPYSLYGLLAPGASALDRAVEAVVHVFVVGKFYLLFSFLFGYSFTLQLEAADRDGARAVPRLLRRSLGLFALGLAHAVLLYSGDILMVYALLGLVLVAARGCSPGAARTAARVVYGCASVFMLLLGLLTLLLSDAEVAGMNAELTASVPDLVAGYRGDAASVVATNAGLLLEGFSSLFTMGGFVVAAFLAGLHCGKRRLLSGASATGAHRARLRRVCLLGTAVGLPGGVFLAMTVVGPLGPRWAVLGQAVGVVTAPALTAAYVCGALLLLRTARGARAGALLAPAGRTALTNYLTQSLVLALVFTGYGLALYDRLGTAAVTLGALVLYAAQLAVSRRLTATHRHGPAEWLLRTVTLARLPRDRAPGAYAGTGGTGGTGGDPEPDRPGGVTR